jgi:FAD:protein FMN transferase
MDPGWIRAAREAMRVRFEIAIAPDQACDSLAAAEEALDEIDRVESRLSAYLPGSDIWELNHAEPRKPVKVQASTIAFLVRARELSLATDGAFDPTVGLLMRLWFDGETVPAEPEISDALACVGLSRVIGIDAETQSVWRTRDGVRFDPGAMGKGWALDRATSILA